MRALSDVDASFLYFETPANHMHVLGALLVDVSDSPGWSSQRVISLIDERMSRMRPLRQRLAPAMWRLHHPVWVDVGHVDLRQHVRTITCRPPGSLSELASEIARFASSQLDRTRPLWECLVVEGLADDKAAVVFKVHHCAVDGVGATRLLAELLDLEAAPPRVQGGSEVDGGALGHPKPSTAAMALHTALGLRRRSLTMVRASLQAQRSASTFVSRRIGIGPAPRTVRRPTPPRAPFNGAITPGRAVAFVDIALQDVKTIKAAVDGTFNDAICAITGTALRHYLLQRGKLPRESLIAAIPVSTRGDHTDTAANRTYAMFVSLGTHLADPMERLRSAHETNAAAKRDQRDTGSSLIARASGVVPPATNEALARFYSAVRFADLHPVVHNLVLSNIAGPPFQVYLAGARLEGFLPFGPVMEGPGLNITMASCLDRVGVGLIACSSRMPDIDRLAAQFPAAVDELLDAVRPNEEHQA